MIADQEYSFLREELDMNRRFVFERPLLIVGAALAAAVPLADKRAFFLLPLPFLAVLLFNLWFTINRLQSSARIIGYIQLVHEGEKNWIGKAGRAACASIGNGFLRTLKNAKR